ncbi:hypothetical protein Tco_0589489, partial [Tanacetum coccineum]
MKKKPKHSTCCLGTFASSFAKVIGSDAVIDSIKAAAIALGTKVVKARSKKELATIAEEKVT